jgi:hypothetical protein
MPAEAQIFWLPNRTGPLEYDPLTCRMGPAPTDMRRNIHESRASWPPPTYYNTIQYTMGQARPEPEMSVQSAVAVQQRLSAFACFFSLSLGVANWQWPSPQRSFISTNLEF